MFLHHVPPPPPPPRKPVTVWVHGTRPSTLLPKVNKEATESLNALSMSPLGLQAAATLAPSRKHYTIARTLSAADPEQFPFESIYIFGWPGDLDPVVRKSSAQALYNDLSQLIAEHQKKHGAPPHITVITHSHGGNVVLNLAPLCKECEITIDRLILMACPVQKETADFSAHPLFKKIYALQSRADFVQLMDMQRLHPFKEIIREFIEERSPASLLALQNAFAHGQQHPLFSERHFTLLPHIIHVDLSWAQKRAWNNEDLAFIGADGFLMKSIISSIDTNQRGLLHNEFIIPSFVKQLPSILATIDSIPPYRLPSDQKNPYLPLKI